MANLTAKQLKELYVKANGNDGADPVTMGAIGMAESSGDPTIVNPSTATGLWQIRWSVWKNDPDIQRLTNGSQESLKDPMTNAKAAGIVYRKHGIDAWTAYTNGAYRTHLASVNTGPSLGDIARAAVDPWGITRRLAGGARDVAEAVTSNVNPSAWVSPITSYVTQVGMVGGIGLLAVILVIMGFVLLVASTKAGKVAATAIPAGKAVNAVKAVKAASK